MTETMLDIDQFRAQARAWIAANLEPRRPKAGREGGGDRTATDLDAARALQRRLFDAGYAGISFPAEYGGGGLTAGHERAFREEAADYVTPDLGVAGGVTFGPIARSLREARAIARLRQTAAAWPNCSALSTGVAIGRAPVDTEKIRSPSTCVCAGLAPRAIPSCAATASRFS